MRLFYILLFAFFSISLSQTSICQAQNYTSGIKMPVVIPASPNAAELGRYGAYDIGLQTGSMGVNVPLFSMEGGLVPLSLSYSTGGIKVDQLASRVGLGWTLQAGGVIIRNVNGRPDEWSTRVFPDLTVLNDNLYNTLSQLATGSSAIDSEPDEFVYNFSGYQGKFILNNEGDAISVPYDNLKIDFSPSSILITTPDGTIYTFATIENTVVVSQVYGADTEQPNIGMQTPTAWYLSKIELPNHELVNFTYSDLIFFNETGTSEVVTKTPEYDDLNECYNCHVLNTDYLTLHTTQSLGKLLSEVTFRSCKMLFSYGNRQDVQDPGDKLLTGVTLFQNGHPVKYAEFSYRYSTSTEQPNANFVQLTYLKYRPFLMDVIEKGSDGMEVRRHSFEYEDMDGLPWRLSFNQDYFGYYNGAFNQNSVPKPDEPEIAAMLPMAKANRNVVPEKAVKGSLRKVIYPTGGALEIEYEGNTYRTSKTLPPPEAIATISIEGPGDYGQTASSPVFTIPNDAASGPAYIIGGVLIQRGMPGDPVPVDETADLMLLEVRSYPADEWVFSHVFKFGDNLEQSSYSFLKGKSYYIRITALHSDEDIRRFSASVKYISGPPSTIYVNEPTGGVRVKKTTLTDGTGKSEIKRYYYASLEHPDITSGFGSKPICYQIFDDVYMPGNCQGRYVYCKMAVAYSSPQSSVYRYGQNHVYYSDVVESIGGDNFEGGGVSHVFKVQKDAFSHLRIGVTGLLGVRYSNTGHLNGVELSQLIFKKQGDNIVKVKETQNTYVVDDRAKTEIDAIYVSRRFVNENHIMPATAIAFVGFEVQTYKVISAWKYKTSSTVTDYDVSGAIAVNTATNYFYDNPIHAQLTRETAQDSKAGQVELHYKYPHEMVAANEDPFGVYSQMITRGIVSPVIKKYQTKAGVQTGLVITRYYSPSPGLHVPQQVQTQNYGDATPVTRLYYHQYDNKGNVGSLSERASPLVSYIYDYRQSLPVAKIVNAGIEEVAYTSFEADGSGYWQINTTGVVDGGIAGKMSYNIANGAVRAGLNSSKKYRVSYWSNTGVKTVSGTVSTVSMPSIGGWQYFEHLVVGVSSIIVSGSGNIDELRLYPDGAVMTSMTYDELSGITSQCNENGIITYYKYDSFGRLRLVQDQEGNVLKKICYRYAGVESDCIGFFGNTVQSRVFTRNDCSNGYAGSEIVYTVPADKYTSAMSQEDANWMALNEINQKGQAWANAHAACNFVYYNDEKSQAFTRNNCSSGTTGSSVIYKVPQATYSSLISKEDANGKALNDIAANGQNYANQHGVCTLACNSSNCSGNNKKCINGICETGVRHNVNTYESGSRWACEYYYQWSDGSTSPIYTQLGSSPCF